MRNRPFAFILPFQAYAALLLVCGTLWIVSACGSAAFASGVSVGRSVVGTKNSGVSLQFSTQKRLGFRAGDDWEPSITSDRFGHIYAMYKHYDVQGGGTCAGCNLHMVFQRSDDEGVTWTQPRAIAPGPIKGKSGQDDAQIAVDPVDGQTVWATYMQNYPHATINAVKSTDFGKTWSEPVVISAETAKPAFDKDELVVRGKLLAVGYDDGFNTWASVSRDGGAHWTAHMVLPGSADFYESLAAGGGIDSRGNLFFSWNSFDQAHSKKGNGPVTLWVTKSSDFGAHWTRTIFGKSGAPVPCHPCGFAYLSAQDAMKIGSDDTIYVLWNSTVGMTNFAAERIYFSRSMDGGKTYETRVDVSDAPLGVEHSFPALAVGKEAGDVRIGWMDKRTGAWNVFYRASLDGGEHFSKEVRVSGYVPGYGYLTKAGYALPYGDYFSIVVDEDGQTQMDFGEGPSYAGPGNIWEARTVG